MAMEALSDIRRAGVSAFDASAAQETDPEFTYTGGRLTRVDYASGNHKTFTYAGGKLDRVDYIVGTLLIRKTFTYNPDGSLSSIVQVEL